MRLESNLINQLNLLNKKRFLNEIEFAKIYIYFIKILQFENLKNKNSEKNPEFLFFLRI